MFAYGKHARFGRVRIRYEADDDLSHVRLFLQHVAPLLSVFGLVIDRAQTAPVLMRQAPLNPVH